MAKKKHALIELLISLKDGDNKAKLATLRRGAADPFNNFEALSIIGKLIPDSRDETFKNSMLISTLFAVHPKQDNDRNIGEALKKVRNALTVGEESLDGRFTLLLNSEYEDLPHNLLQICRFLANKEVGIDFHQLFDDLKYWTHQDKFVQRNWAKGYWGNKKETENQEQNVQQENINNNQEN